jgi:hypothetical protein
MAYCRTNLRESEQKFIPNWNMCFVCRYVYIHTIHLVTVILILTPTIGTYIGTEHQLMSTRGKKLWKKNPYNISGTFSAR